MTSWLISGTATMWPTAAPPPSYGASHHSFPAFQVAVDVYCRDRTIGGTHLRFVRSSRVGSAPVRRQPYGHEAAQVTVSTPEATVLDLVDRPQLGGGLDYVATILGDLQAFGLLDARELAVVSEIYPKAIVQRAGHILDYMSRELAGMIDRPLDLGPLEHALAARGTKTVTLSCGHEAPQLEQQRPLTPIGDGRCSLTTRSSTICDHRGGPSTSGGGWCPGHRRTKSSRT